MRRVAGRMQTVGAGILVLAVTVAAPALSAAQQGAADPNATPTDPPLTTPTPPEPPLPPEAGQPEDGSLDQGGAPATQQVASQAQTETTAPEPQAAPQKQAKAAAAKTVSIGDNFYSPASITIKIGDTVTWKNNGAAPHSATADDGSFDTGVFNGGQSRSETFSSAGTISYFCTVHGQAQSGTIKVLAASGGGGGSDTSSSGTSEADAVASSGAAGSSSSLPATGFAAVFLAAIGMTLLGSGSALRRRALAREAGRKRRARLFSL